tara:strand:- start:72 stop:224 length:153 start_codon:yes stop_codon:yes gene_type:complete
MTIFLCKNCGYKFEGKLGYNPRKCPYCSEENIAEEGRAEDILKEVEDLLE